MVSIPLTTADIKYLERRLAEKDYSGGYQYLYDVAQKAIANQADGEVRDPMLMAANWLISAKSINNLDRTFVSEIVYNSMRYAVERSGRQFTSRMYKNASDKLAHQVIADFINAKAILPIKEVIKRDVQAAVEGLGLEPWHWGGTLGDEFPVWMGGLGHDYVEIPGRTFLEQMENYATVFIQNAAAIGMIVERYLDDVSMVVSIAAKVILERLLIAEVEINILLPLIPGGGISNGTGGGGGSGVTSASNGYSTGGGLPVTSGEKPVANVDISLESVGGLNYITPEQISKIKCLLDRKIDPLILDLNGSGIKLTSPHVSPVHFDMNNDGEKVQTGWSSTEEGIVVVDLDGDGKIDDVSELMSEYFGAEQGNRDSPSEKTFDNAFDALRSLDSNKDLKFDNQDHRWSDVKIWIDADHDGQSWVDGPQPSESASELHTLDELGISHIDLKYTKPLADIRSGNDIVGVSNFTQKGEVKEAVAVNFSIIVPDGSSADKSPK